MRSKAPLALMEQLVMLLVFALAAALCVQVFVLSDQSSRRNEARDRAVLVAQNAAELLKSGAGDPAEREAEAARQLGGSYEQGTMWVDYDENWEPVDGGAGAYRLTATGQTTDVPGLYRTTLCVTTGDEEPDMLFQLDVAWQTEVKPNG
jgi:type II secretory pathway pseudopilin PulG